MTDTALPTPTDAELNGDNRERLPLLVKVTSAFSSRLPSQRVMDAIARVEVGETFADLAGNQPFRIVAFRALLRDYPNADPATLWLHSYDVEVDVEEEANPTDGRSPTASRDSAASGA